jgi:hypothetical protein
MLSFIKLFEDIPHEIHRSEHGITYAHKIGDHHILTHFLTRNNSHYDVHFTRNTPGSIGDGFSRKGMSKLSPEERIKSVRSVSSAVKHFVDNEKPSALTASANTKDKSDVAHHVFSHMAKRSNATVSKNGSDTTIHYH